MPTPPKESHGPTLPYPFHATPWHYTGTGGWVFVSLPQDMAEEIRALVGRREEQGWGRLTATARIGNTQWKSAIWWDTKHQTYLLPLKADIRKKENIQPGVEVSVTIWV